jgi:hypothetical protein
MQEFWLPAIAGWLIPGAGYIWLGRWKRGVIIGAAIWIMLIIGIASGGAIYPGVDIKQGMLLYIIHVFACLGSGSGYLLNLVFSSSAPPDVAAWSTFEYGGRFLEAAGLLNYLAAIDTYDIAARRKA